MPRRLAAIRALAKELEFIRFAGLSVYIFIPALAVSHVYLSRQPFSAGRERLKSARESVGPAANCHA
jgi:hypothetical protein